MAVPMTGSSLQKARVKAGLSRADLASALGVVERSVWRWERGDTPIKKKYVAQIRAALKGQKASA